MRTYFAYIRVSTIKQGEKGSSLTEQRDAILIYAAKNGLSVCEFFEEQQTAAKLGRATFRKMLNRLKRGGAHGLIMHKVDRGARNLADWAEIAALKDIGIDVHFAHEAIDLNSRGGRLSADIQAVVASDFIRNLRDEVKKGLYGRLKQGCYPFKAPPGYKDNGKGQLKTIDPVQGPLMREAFEKYAGGDYGLHGLTAHMNARGLRNSAGKPFCMSGLAVTLANPFYYGLLLVKEQSFVGKHTPLISKSLFDQCRARAEGRLVSKTRVWGKAEYRFRGLLTCIVCKRHLYAETQKGHVYYRCAKVNCKGTCVRESDIEAEILLPFSYVPNTPLLIQSLTEMFEIHSQKQGEREREQARINQLKRSQLRARTERLTDLLIEGTLSQGNYQVRNQALQKEGFDLDQELADTKNTSQYGDRLAKYLELVKGLQNIAEMPNSHIFREYAKSAISNLSVNVKTLEVSWSKAVLMLLDMGGFYVGAHERNESRTCIYYDTHGDIFASLCSLCVTERDNHFNKQLIERGGELFTAIIYDKSLDQVPIERKEPSGMAFATRFVQQKPKVIVREEPE